MYFVCFFFNFNSSNCQSSIIYYIRFRIGSRLSFLFSSIYSHKLSLSQSTSKSHTMFIFIWRFFFSFYFCCSTKAKAKTEAEVETALNVHCLFVFILFSSVNMYPIYSFNFGIELLSMNSTLILPIFYFHFKTQKKYTLFVYAHSLILTYMSTFSLILN